MSGQPVPTSITDYRGSAVLRIVWSDGVFSELPHSLLRKRCRCAECTQAARSGSAAAIGPDVHLTSIHPVADRGINLVFSDGHHRGIYPWPYLRELGMALA